MLHVKLAARGCAVLLGLRTSIAGGGTSRHKGQGWDCEAFCERMEVPCSWTVGRMEEAETAGGGFGGLSCDHTQRVDAGPGGTEGLNTDSGSFSMGIELQERYCQEATPVTSTEMDEVNERKGSVRSAWAMSSHLPFS